MLKATITSKHTYVLERGVGLMEEVREARRQDEVVLCEVEEERGANQQRQVPCVRSDRVHAHFEDLSDHLGQHRGNQDLPFVQVGQADGVLLPVSDRQSADKHVVNIPTGSVTLCVSYLTTKKAVMRPTMDKIIGGIRASHIGSEWGCFDRYM
jgi:hypothetical protein